MKTNLFLFIYLLMATVCSKAQEANLKMKFDFSNITGTSVKDDVSGITATLVNNAKVMSMGKYKVLNLGTTKSTSDTCSHASYSTVWNSATPPD